MDNESKQKIRNAIGDAAAALREIGSLQLDDDTALAHAASSTFEASDKMRHVGAMIASILGYEIGIQLARSEIEFWKSVYVSFITKRDIEPGRAVLFADDAVRDLRRRICSPETSISKETP